MPYTDGKQKMAEFKAKRRNMPPEPEDEDRELPKKRKHVKRPYAIEQRFIYYGDGKPLWGKKIGNWFNAGRYETKRDMMNAMETYKRKGRHGWMAKWGNEYRIILPEGEVLP